MTDAQQRAVNALNAVGLPDAPLASLEREDALFVLTPMTLLYQGEGGTRRVTLRDLTRIHSDQEGLLRVETPAGTALTASLLGFDPEGVQAFFARVRDVTAQVKSQPAPTPTPPQPSAPALTPLGAKTFAPRLQAQPLATPTPAPAPAPAPLATAPAQETVPDLGLKAERPTSQPQSASLRQESPRQDAPFPPAPPMPPRVTDQRAGGKAVQEAVPAQKQEKRPPSTPTSVPYATPPTATIVARTGAARPVSPVTPASAPAPETPAPETPEVSAAPSPSVQTPAAPPTTPTEPQQEGGALPARLAQASAASGLAVQSEVVAGLVSRLRVLGGVLFVAAVALAFFQYQAGAPLSGLWTLIAGGVGGVALLALSDIARLLVGVARHLSHGGAQG